MESTNKPFGLKDKVGYMFGDFGNDFTFILSSMFLLKFYTDVMGVSAGVVGTIMMIARFVDSVTDVTMGQLVDRSRTTKKGKFAPWLLRMCGPVAVASFLMYASWFSDFPLAFKIVWLFVTYILWGSVFYTSVNIPYGSMASAISLEPHDRTSLSTARSIGAALASMFIGVVLPLVVYYEDANGNKVLSGTRMTVAALVCSIGAVICYLVCYNLVTERVSIARKTDRFSFKELVETFTKNKSLVGIVVSAFFLLLATLSLGTMTTYLFSNYFKDLKAQSISAFISVVVTLLCATFINPLSTIIGKKNLAILGSAISVVTFLVLFVMQTESVTTFVIMYEIAYLGQAFFTLICWAMITDVIDDIEVRTGKRSDGTVYAIYSFARKCGQALSSGLSGLLLSIIGYTSTTQNDDAVVRGIYNITCLAPMIGFVLVIVSLIVLYPLGKDRVRSNVKALKARRLEEEEIEKNNKL